jgi:DNA-binding transcriptional LysR family regulator
MARITQWERHIGARLRLRHLYVFFTVVKCGSMAKAASQLGVSTPSISDVIADLEDALRVRLLDRTPKGVVPTDYGQAILARGHAAFDELRQGIRDIEFISDPTAGEVRIGCSESLLAFLALVIERLSCKHPRMRFHVQQVHWPTVEFPELHKREIDLVLARLMRLPMHGQVDEDLNAEVLFDDPFLAVVGSNSKWARRRNLDLADLVDESWLLTPLDVLAGLFFTEAFEAKGLKPPKPRVASYSPYLRSSLASRGQFIAVLPRSVLHVDAERYSLKRLPIQLSNKPSPVAIVTLRNRTLTPAVQVFIECAREIANSVFGQMKGSNDPHAGITDVHKKNSGGGSAPQAGANYICS